MKLVFRLGLALAFGGVGLSATGPSALGVSGCVATSPVAEKGKPTHQFTGIVHTGVMAIGGESTGVILETKTGKYELDVEGDQKLAAELEALDGKRATITGDYEKRAGVEVKERHVIVVWRIEPASRGN